jgi:hypothetical protein
MFPFLHVQIREYWVRPVLVIWTIENIDDSMSCNGHQTLTNAAASN